MAAVRLGGLTALEASELARQRLRERRDAELAEARERAAAEAAARAAEPTPVQTAAREALLARALGGPQVRLSPSVPAGDSRSPAACAAAGVA